MSETTIAAVVVLYFPNEALLERLLRAIKDEVAIIFVINNTPKESDSSISEKWFLSKAVNVVYQELGDNYGIAKAQNIGVQLAIDNHCSHVVFFDQDSAPSSDMITNLLLQEQALLSEGFNVGALGPAYLDEKTGCYSKVIRFGRLFSQSINVRPNDVTPIQADFLIASGSLIRVNVFNQIGLMREDLFIDGVDVEWILRAAHFGYQHFIVPKALMLHSIGESFVRVGTKNIDIHNDIRNYYKLRNLCHLALNPKMGKRFRTNMISKIPLYVLVYTLVSKQRFSTFKFLLRACIDGFYGRLGKVSGV
jgi:rhamnosyltransferase